MNFIRWIYGFHYCYDRCIMGAVFFGRKVLRPGFYWVFHIIVQFRLSSPDRFSLFFLFFFINIRLVSNSEIVSEKSYSILLWLNVSWFIEIDFDFFGKIFLFFRNFIVFLFQCERTSFACVLHSLLFCFSLSFSLFHSILFSFFREEFTLSPFCLLTVALLFKVIKTHKNIHRDASNMTTHRTEWRQREKNNRRWTKHRCWNFCKPCALSSVRV